MLPSALGAGPTAEDLLDRAPCGFVSFRDDGIIVAANTTLATMLGVTRDELLGAHMDRVLTVPARIYYQTHFFPLLTLHGAAEEIYLALRGPNGDIVHVLATARRVASESRNDCVFMRIHERQRYERELLRAKKVAEEANRAKSRLLSMMSHDLRTPLSAISGYADLLLMGVRGEISDAQAQDLRRVKSASAYLLGLLNDILAFARIEVGQVEYRLTDVNVATALGRAEALVGPRFEQAGVHYRREEWEANLAARADADRLQQVLLNLLTNAAKFTPRDGHVTVEGERTDGDVLIRVRDTGRGVPADKLETIFEPFQQVEPADQGRGGVGLGLSISRELARAMGGDITVASVLGQGSVFEVRLPAAPPASG